MNRETRADNHNYQTVTTIGGARHLSFRILLRLMRTIGGLAAALQPFQ